MKIKREYIILAAVILILSVYLILRKQDRSFYDLPDIPSISREDIAKIEISKKDSKILLNKKNTAWHIAPEEYMADKDKISGMLDIIEKLSLTALVSESKNYDIYDLGDDKKITVKAWSSDGSLKREFQLGKPAESYRHTHVRLPQDDRIYHASTNFRPKFDQTEEDLRDKTVLSFDKKDINKIAFIKQDKTYEFDKNESEKTDDPGRSTDTNDTAKPADPVWKYIGNSNVDQTRLESLLDIVSKLKCEKYLTNMQKDNFKRPDLTLTLTGTQEYVLKIFAKKD
ncbi:MAG: DUF4340 domain-containing protein, partial [Desulfobacterales bacterium]|nr:DUF4340 domain-containing protein [Desulfobacterales bacterium]